MRWSHFLRLLLKEKVRQGNPATGRVNNRVSWRGRGTTARRAPRPRGIWYPLGGRRLAFAFDQALIVLRSAPPHAGESGASCCGARVKWESPATSRTSGILVGRGRKVVVIVWSGEFTAAHLGLVLSFPDLEVFNACLDGDRGGRAWERCWVVAASGWRNVMNAKACRWTRG